MLTYNLIIFLGLKMFIRLGIKNYFRREDFTFNFRFQIKIIFRINSKFIRHL